MKYCPNCGKELPEDAQFCTNCGYRTASAPKSAAQGTAVQPTAHATQDKRQAPAGHESVRHTPRARIINDRQPQRRKHRHRWGWLLVLILMLAVTGFWFYNNHDNGDNSTAAPASSSSTSQSSAVSSSSATQSSSSSNDVESTVSSSSTSDKKLTTDIGPKNTAAAVTYYAAKNGVSHWKGVLNTTDGITVQLSTNDDLLNALSEPGQGMAYMVYGYHNVDADDETDFIYTVDRDDTIHIYTLPNDFDSNQTYEPEMTVSKQDMVNYLNDHDDAGSVAKLSTKVDIDR